MFFKESCVLRGRQRRSPRAAVPRFRGPKVVDFASSGGVAAVVIFCFNLFRFSIQHDPILDPKLAPISPSFDLLFPITFPIRFPTSFWTDFGPQIDSKINSDTSSKIKLQTTPISASSSIKFRRQSHVQAKWSIFKNRSKTECFCMFFKHPLMPTQANTRHATHSKIIRNHIQNQRFFHRN